MVGRTYPRVASEATRRLNAVHPLSRRTALPDLIFVVIIVAFFVLAALFIRACDRIVGPDEGTASWETPGEQSVEGQAV